MITIDLGKYRSQNSKVFAGRERGQAVRKNAGLDQLDAEHHIRISIHVPEDVFSVNTSFFLGMFGDSIRTLGETEFRRRFEFTGRPLGRVYETAIREASATHSPFEKGER